MSKPLKPKGPAMYDLEMQIKNGIDPKTGNPTRMSDFKLKSDTKILLRIKDEQDAVNRFVWNFIPMNLSKQDIERMLYYNHSLCFFYFKPMEEFLLLPYTMVTGSLDFYGRPQYVNPVPFVNGTTESDRIRYAQQKQYLSNVNLRVIYDVQLEEDFMDDEGNLDESKAKELVENSCVIIKDYTPQYNAVSAIPRATLQDSLLDVMADCIPFSHTAMLNSTGVVGIGTNSADEDAAVLEFSDTVNSAALLGKKFLPIHKTTGIDLQELTNGTAVKCEEFLQTMQSYNNFRLSLYGLDNNGLYDKKAYVNNMQSGVSNVGLSLQDGLINRQHACNIINSIQGCGIQCDISETVSGMDTNMDGDTYEDEDQTGQYNGGQTMEVSANE